MPGKPGAHWTQPGREPTTHRANPRPPRPPAWRVVAQRTWDRLPMIATALAFAARVPDINDGRFDTSVTSPATHHWWALAWATVAVMSAASVFVRPASRFRVASGVVAILVLVFWPLGVIGDTDAATVATWALTWWAAVLVAWSWGRLR